MPIDPQEVQEAVDKIVPGFVQYRYDRLGVRVQHVTWSGFRNAVLGALLSRDGAPFYIVRLGRDRLIETISTVQATVDELDEACTSTARRVQPVSRTSTLSNARVALDALAASMAERTGVYQSITEIPTFKRFENNINQFLNEEGKKVRYRGELTDTPQQAQAKLRTLAVQLRKQWDELLEKTTTWAESIDSYVALNLPATLSQVIMENASDVLSSRIAELDALTPEERLKVLRSLVVDTVAVKTTVKNFGSLEPPTTFILLDGVGRVVADAEHPATPARLPSDYMSGYNVYEGMDTLNLLVDGVHNITVNPPGSFVARHDCPVRGPFTLTASTNLLRLSYERNNGPGYSTAAEDVVLPVGSVEPWVVADAINTSVSQAAAGVFFTIPKTTQEADFASVGMYSGTFTLTNGVLWSSAGVVVGDRLIIPDGSTVTMWTVTLVAGAVLTCDVVYGGFAWPASPTTVTVGADEYLRFFITLRNAGTALARRTALQLLDGEEGTCAALGLYATSKMLTHRTSAESFAQWVNQSSASASVDGVPRLSATTELLPQVFEGMGCSHPEDALLLSVHRFRGEVTILSTSIVGTVFEDAELAAQALVGDVLVVRGTTDASDTNIWGLVTAVTDSQVAVGVVVAGTGVALVAVGRSFYPFTDDREELEVQILDETENGGVYAVSTDPAPTPLDLRLAQPLPLYVGLGGQPVLLAQVQVCQRRVVILSQSTGLDSSVTVLGTGNFDSYFVSTVPTTAVGTTNWVSLPTIPRRLEAGDALELHNTEPLTPSIVSKVTVVDTESKLIGVETPLATTQPAFSFTSTSTLPFARLRKTVRQNFDEVSGNVSDWLQLPINNVLHTFRSLDAALNPLVANNTPSMAQANMPRVVLDDMTQALEALNTYLAEYDAAQVDEVDSLIKGFTQKGLDRAVDVLLSGDFAAFFDLDADSSSYSGYLQKTLRDVQKGDFPVRKDNRADATFAAEENTIAQFDDVDFEYTADQLDTNQRIDFGEENSPSYTLPV